MVYRGPAHGDGAKTLLAVTRHHDCGEVEGLRVEREIDADCIAARDHDRLVHRRVTDQARVHEITAGRYAGDRVAAVGLRPRATVADADEHPGNRLLRAVVDDTSANGTGGLLSGERGGPRQCQERAHRTMEPVHTTSRAVNSSRGCLDARVSRRARFIACAIQRFMKASRTPSSPRPAPRPNRYGGPCWNGRAKAAPARMT